MEPGQRREQRAEAPGMQADPLRPQRDGPERERQHERAQHLRIELVEVEEKRRHEREAERERGGEARAAGGVAHQQEHGRHQPGAERAEEQHAHGHAPGLAARAVQRAIGPQRRREQERGPRREHRVDAAVLAADHLAGDARGGDRVPAGLAAGDGAEHPPRLAAEDGGRRREARGERPRLELLHRAGDGLGVERQPVPERHGLPQRLRLVAGVRVPVPGPLRHERRVGEEAQQEHLAGARRRKARCRAGAARGSPRAPGGPGRSPSPA